MNHDPDKLQTKIEYTPIVETHTLFMLWENLLNKFSFQCVRRKAKRDARQLGQKGPHAEGVVFAALLSLPCSASATRPYSAFAPW